MTIMTMMMMMMMTQDGHLTLVVCPKFKFSCDKQWLFKNRPSNTTSIDQIREHFPRKSDDIFTARRNARIASAALATAIPSVCFVCLSVCHSTPVLRQNDVT